MSMVATYIHVSDNESKSQSANGDTLLSDCGSVMECLRWQLVCRSWYPHACSLASPCPRPDHHCRITSTKSITSSTQKRAIHLHLMPPIPLLNCIETCISNIQQVESPCEPASNFCNVGFKHNWMSVLPHEHTWYCRPPAQCGEGVLTPEIKVNTHASETRYRLASYVGSLSEVVSQLSRK